MNMRVGIKLRCREEVAEKKLQNYVAKFCPEI